jgi:hypothetical protein
MWDKLNKPRTGIVALVLLILGLFADLASAQSRDFYDASGHKVGSSTTLPGGRTDFYDDRGRRTGSSFTTNKGGRIDFYNDRGARTGSDFFRGRK